MSSPDHFGELLAGTRVRVTQQIAARHYAMITPVEGTVLDVQRKPTGSWYAHGQADKLWLDRLTLRKSDGEVTVLNLDAYSYVERLT